MLLLAGMALVIAAVVVWRYTPLAELLTSDRIASTIGSISNSSWSPILLVLAFIAGGVLCVPLVLLVGATAIVLPPLIAAPTALAGALASAAVTYLIGAKLLRGTARDAFGTVIKKLKAALTQRGVVAIAIIRNIPIAPYSVVNVAAGCIGLSFRDYILGTALGMLPGILAVTAFGGQLKAIIDAPTAGNIAWLVAIVVGWIGLSLAAQKIIVRRQNSSRE